MESCIAMLFVLPGLPRYRLGQSVMLFKRSINAFVSCLHNAPIFFSGQVGQSRERRMIVIDQSSGSPRPDPPCTIYSDSETNIGPGRPTKCARVRGYSDASCGGGAYSNRGEFFLQLVGRDRVDPSSSLPSNHPLETRFSPSRVRSSHVRRCGFGTGGCCFPWSMSCRVGLLICLARVSPRSFIRLHSTASSSSSFSASNPRWKPVSHCPLRSRRLMFPW